MPFEAADAFGWLYATLAGDATLATLLPGGWFRGYAPTGSLAPYGVIARQSGTDTTNSQGKRMLVRDLYQVVAYGPSQGLSDGSYGGYAQLRAAASRIDALIGDQRNQVGPNGVVISASTRESELNVQEVVNGVSWDRAGGLYRLMLQA